MADATEPTGKHGFLAELSRRHVWRAAVLYAGAAWALAQGIAQLGPLFNAPNWAMRGFVIACIIGFPFWVAFAWFYAWTPEGFKREEEVERTPSLSRATSRKLDLGIIGVLIVAVVLLASGYFVHRSAPAGTEAATFNPPADTLVVLPFANESGDPKQQYFSDGITEELTNALGQNTALRVIAWDTASHYRDRTQSATAVGKALDVANVLTGKVQRQGNDVRVIVELVNARTGYQVWANHYDDSLANVFQVQDKISAAIAQALQVKFASLGGAPTVNPQAHDLVLQARALMDKTRTAAPLEQARDLLERAIALDPGYADAHAGLARALYRLTQYATLPIEDALPRVRAEAHKALALDPRNVSALLSLANVDRAEGKLAEARAGFERALAIDPSDSGAHVDYGTMLPLQQALAQQQEAVQLDPDNAAAQNNLALYAFDLGEYAQALAPSLAVMRLDPTSADNALALAQTYALMHRDADAVKVFDLVQPRTELAKALVAAGRLTYQSLLDPELHGEALAAVDALRRRSDLDAYSMADVIQLELALGQNPTALEQLPKLCATLPIGCSDLSVNPTWLPLRGDPRFQQLVRQYDTVSKPPASAAPASSSP
ncbi:MAG: Adenylate cyclase [Rhodanobacteraceae bacterium]|jgi:TolB-like protein/Tfp pilus assembly protein PilF|nr:MAG: Adenylate cyclase [Rhodanobacteraceae bacterium]